uniref:Uncharacterized protein n=1 Tax=Anguilla anguilla TaxID=7936 RepID=A0A0E9U363_ANGAN
MYKETINVAGFKVDVTNQILYR